MKYKLHILVFLVALLGCSSPPKSTLNPHYATVAPRSISDSAIVVAAARQYIGVDYRYGGNGRSGFDCSGLVQTVFTKVGVSLPRTTREQAAVGARVSRNELAPGDLVLFADEGGRVSHVGIWAGNGRFVHASSSRGVVEDSLASSYFDGRFIGGRRVLHH